MSKKMRAFEGGRGNASRQRRLQRANVEVAGGAAEAAKATERRRVTERRRRGERRARRDGRRLRGEQRLLDGDLARARVPVAAAGHDGVLADVEALETKVGRDDVVAAVNEAGDVRRDGRVVSDAAARDVADVVGERAERRDDLSPDDGLDLNLADLGGDNALGELEEDGHLLLDDGDRLGLADNSLAEDGLLVVVAAEVVRAVEAVEAVEAGEATPVVEGGAAQAGDGRAGGRRGGGGGRDRLVAGDVGGSGDGRGKSDDGGGQSEHFK